MAEGLTTVGGCPTNAFPSAVFDILRQALVASVTVNSNCNQIGECEGPFALEAVWDSNLRAPDWRGHHRVIWRLLCDTEILAVGRMEGCTGIGTHRKPPLDRNCEECNECNHFEGKMMGVVTAEGPARGTRIEACYAGEFVDDQGDPISCCPLPKLPPRGPFRMTIDGVVVLRGCIGPQQ